MNPNFLAYRALYKTLPKEPRTSFRALWRSFDENKYTQSEADSIATIMKAVKSHDEFLKFFNIAQRKDEMDKIAKVSKYVGLAPPKLWKP